jgi:hypothetical protein
MARRKVVAELPDRPGAPQAQCTQCSHVFQSSDLFDEHQKESYRGKGRGTITCIDPKRLYMIQDSLGVWRKR